MNKISFRLRIVPPKTTHQAKKIVRVGGFSRLADKPELQVIISDYMTLLRPYVPEKPLEGAIRIHLEFTFPWRVSESKKNRAKGAIPMATKPDWDNMAKTIVDVMGKLMFFGNDSQIYSATVEKYRGDVPGIFASIEEFNEGVGG